MCIIPAVRTLVCVALAWLTAGTGVPRLPERFARSYNPSPSSHKSPSPPPPPPFFFFLNRTPVSKRSVKHFTLSNIRSLSLCPGTPHECNSACPPPVIRSPLTLPHPAANGFNANALYHENFSPADSSASLIFIFHFTRRPYRQSSCNQALTKDYTQIYKQTFQQNPGHLPDKIKKLYLFILHTKKLDRCTFFMTDFVIVKT